MEGAGNTFPQKNLTDEGSKFIINLESLTGQEDDTSCINTLSRGNPALFQTTGYLFHKLQSFN